MPITLRGTKGSALTYEEMDDNFLELSSNIANIRFGFTEVLETGNVVANGTYALSYNGASFATSNTRYYTDMWNAKSPWQYHTFNVGLGLFSWGSIDNNGFDITVNRSRSGVQGTHEIVQNGDELFYLGVGGSDGTRFKPAGDIRFEVDGNPIANGNVPAKISFYTTNTTQQYPTAKMSIGANGNVNIASTLAVGSQFEFMLDDGAGYPGIRLIGGSTPLYGNYLWFDPASGTGYPGDFLGGMYMYMRSSTGVNRFAGSIHLTAANTSNTIESANLIFTTIKSGFEGARCYVAHGFVVGNPTGSDKGTGTINAQAVYDDNVILTCYIADVINLDDGDIIDANTTALIEKWDAVVPDRITYAETIDPITNKPIRGEEIIEPRVHAGARKFFERIGTEYDPRDITKALKHFRDKKHLTPFPNPDSWEHNSMTVGDWIQRLIEQAELNAVWVYRERKERLQLENYVQRLEDRIANDRIQMANYIQTLEDRMTTERAQMVNFAQSLQARIVALESVANT